MGWVTIKKAAEDTGYSVPALRAKIKRGQFEEGHHWCRAPDGNLMISMPNFMSWISSNTVYKGQQPT